MKTLLVVSTASLFCAALLAQSAPSPPHSNPPPATGSSAKSSAQESSADADATRKLVGVWVFSSTNATQWMSTRTEYRADGTYSMRGDVGEPDRSFSRAIGDDGIWRVEAGYLCITVTNKVSGIRMRPRYQILSISADRFAYRTGFNQLQTALRKQ